MKTVYLINPVNSFPDYFGGEVIGHDTGRRGVSVAELAVATVATMMRPYFNVIICDEHISDVDYDIDADFIALTGKITQWNSAKKISTRFRELGKTIIIGGPFASLVPDTVRPYADILVTGEIEEVSGEIFKEISSGKWKDHYEGQQADLAKAVLPSWDLYPTHRSMSGNLQVSRGCPFQCEFCDVIQYLGRNQRHKPIGKVLEELDLLQETGYINSFISDDNFTVYRSRAKEVLSGLKEWNNAVPGRTHKFTTQVSLDVTRDEEMLEMLNEAGFSSVFTGIETPNEESLKETRKFQNTKIDIAKEVKKFFEHGVAVTAGLIVGFDHDNADIFERQFEFAMKSSIPYFSLNYLSAYESTPLYARLKKDGRILDSKDVRTDTQYASNVKLLNINDEEKYYGMRWLISNMYSPENFGERLTGMLSMLAPAKVLAVSPLTNKSGGITRDVSRVIRNLKTRGEAERKMSQRVISKIKEKPYTASIGYSFLYFYAQLRFMLDSPSGGRMMYDRRESGKPVFSMV